MLRQRILALEDEVARLMEAREDAEQRVLDAKAETAEARAAEATSAQAVKQLEARLDEAHGTAAEHDEHAANIEAAMLELQVCHCASSVPACAGLTETQCVSAPPSTKHKQLPRGLHHKNRPWLPCETRLLCAHSALQCTTRLVLTSGLLVHCVSQLAAMQRRLDAARAREDSLASELARATEHAGTVPRLVVCR